MRAFRNCSAALGRVFQLEALMAGLFIAIAHPCASEPNIAVAQPPAIDSSYFKIAFDPIGDTTVATLGVAGILTSRLMLESIDFNGRYPGTLDSAPFIDRITAQPYSVKIDSSSDIVQYAAMAAPYAASLFMDHDEALASWLLTAETQILAFASKDGLKTIVQRPRPYNFFSSAPSELLADKDRYLSFPSGHAAMAFASSSLATVYAIRLIKNETARFAVIGASNGLALTTAILRVYAGAHFLTDVIAGSLLGACIGTVNGLLHIREREDANLVIATTNAGATLRLSLSLP